LLLLVLSILIDTIPHYSDNLDFTNL
jgi:hypothetical protein